MNLKIVKIGNSRGVRLPKALLEQVGMSGSADVEVRNGSIILRAPVKKAKSSKTRNPRAGWEEQIRKVIAEHGNELSDEDREWLDAPLSEEADKDWKW